MKIRNGFVSNSSSSSFIISLDDPNDRIHIDNIYFPLNINIPYGEDDIEISRLKGMGDIILKYGFKTEEQLLKFSQCFEPFLEDIRNEKDIFIITFDDEYHINYNDELIYRDKDKFIIMKKAFSD